MSRLSPALRPAVQARRLAGANIGELAAQYGVTVPEMAEFIRNMEPPEDLVPARQGAA